MSISPAASYYVEGRTSAFEDFDANDYDLDVLIRHVLAGEDLREVCKQAIAADLATDAHDGTKDAWLADHEEECEEQEISPTDAYEEWTRGYMDRGSFDLETVMEDAFDEALEEVTAVETPAAKTSRKKFSKVTRVNPAPNPASRGTTLADWYATGIQDCQNSWDATELDNELDEAVRLYLDRGKADVKPWAGRAVNVYWKASEEAGSKADWMSQNRADLKADGLDAEAAYAEWAAGWKEQAKSYAAIEIARRAADR
jgi:hypothetical protein